MIFRRRPKQLTQEPQVKDARELSPVEETMNEINRLQRAIDHLLLARKRDARIGRHHAMLLEDTQRELLTKCYHTYKVIPVINTRSGYWQLYDGTNYPH